MKTFVIKRVQTMSIPHLWNYQTGTDSAKNNNNVHKKYKTVQPFYIIMYFYVDINRIILIVYTLLSSKRMYKIKESQQYQCQTLTRKNYLKNVWIGSMSYWSAVNHIFIRLEWLGTICFEKYIYR